MILRLYIAPTLPEQAKESIDTPTFRVCIGNTGVCVSGFVRDGFCTGLFNAENMVRNCVALIS